MKQGGFLLRAQLYTFQIARMQNFTSPLKQNELHRNSKDAHCELMRMRG